MNASRPTDHWLSARELSLVALFAALSGVGGFIRVPLPYVPLTLQSLIVMVSGLILGGRLAALSQLIYILVGLLGIPVFAHGGGPGYVLQPTFGYLGGFVIGAYVVGRLCENRQRLQRHFLLPVLFAGTAAIYFPGFTVLYLNLNFVQQKAISLSLAAKIGLLLPLPGDLLKIALLVYIGPLLYERFRPVQTDPEPRLP